MTRAERLQALRGNLKNWDGSVFPQFKIEKEDGEALFEILQIKDMVAIKDFEIPGVCADCEMYFGGCCCITGSELIDEFSCKLEDCPLVKVKVIKDGNDD